MAASTDKEMAIARVYAISMLELAESQGQADTLREEFTDLSAFVAGDARLRDFFSNPTVDADARSEMIEKTFRGRASHLLVTSLQVINRKDRLGLLSAIADQYRLAHESLRGRIEVSVRTAAPLPDDLREKLKNAAQTCTSKDPVLIEQVDPAVVGGFVVQIGDLKFDLSVATQLKRLRNALHDRASHELGQRVRYVIDGAA